MQEERQIQTKDAPDNVFMEQLTALLKSKEMLQIYTNFGDTQKFSVGFVYALTSTEILIAHVTPYGKYDGYIVKQLKDIYRIETQSKYINKLKKLYSHEKKEHTVIEQTHNSLVSDLLSFAYHNQKIVSLELLESDNDDIIGFVDSLQSGLARISTIDEYGKSDGVSFIKTDDITHAVCDSENEIALKTLAND